MLEKIGVWFVKLLLEYLVGLAREAFEEKKAKLEEDRARNEVNEENVKAYEEALTRKERVDAALDLLNRTP